MPFQFWFRCWLEVLQNLLAFGGVLFGRDHVAALQALEFVEAVFDCSGFSLRLSYRR